MGRAGCEGCEGEGETVVSRLAQVHSRMFTSRHCTSVHAPSSPFVHLPVRPFAFLFVPSCPFVNLPFRPPPSAEYSKGFEQRDGLPPLPRVADEERPPTGPLPTAGELAGGEGLDGGGDGDDDGGRGGSGGGGARAARPRGSPSQRSRASVGKSVGKSVGPTDNEATAALFAKDYNPVATYAGDRSGLRFRPVS